MIRRLMMLLAVAGGAYFVYTRFFRSPPVLVDDDWDLDFDSPPPPLARSDATAPPPAPATTTAEPTEPERIRALVGSDDAGTATEEPAADEPSADQPAESEPMIKGNVRDDGEKIYHMPDDPTYARTRAEQFFATSEEAEAAGFRRAGRPGSKG